MASNVLASILGLAYVVVIAVCFVSVWFSKRKRIIREGHLPSFYTCQPRYVCKGQVLTAKISSSQTNSKVYLSMYDFSQNASSFHAPIKLAAIHVVVFSEAATIKCIY